MERGLITEGGVFAVGVVVALDVLEDFGLSVGGGLEAAALEHFVFEGADEGFGPGVVVGIGRADMLWRRPAWARALRKEVLAYWLPRSLWKMVWWTERVWRACWRAARTRSERR